jgi:hypothetical protein
MNLDREQIRIDRVQNKHTQQQQQQRKGAPVKELADKFKMIMTVKSDKTVISPAHQYTKQDAIIATLSAKHAHPDSPRATNYNTECSDTQHTTKTHLSIG